MTVFDTMLENILETIGQTPIVRLNRSAEGLVPSIAIKAESFNPGGSAKDRIAMSMIENAEHRGELRPGGTIIEATAGNTGLGLALVGAVRGYRCIFVMPDKMSDDKIRLLRAYGAEVVITPSNVPPDSPDSYNGVAERLSREIPGAWRPNQFSNISNPEAHYRTTGPEIWDQTGGRITVFVAAAGTGGTLSGVGRFLKEKNSDMRIIGADIEGSILSGDSPKPWKVEGIGEDFVPKTLNAQVIDEWIRVSDAESFSTARRVSREDGIMLGGSSGTALAAAFKYASRCSREDLVVVLCPDTGRNYLSKMYNDEWMAENGFADRAPDKVTVGDLLKTLGRAGKILSLKPEDTLQTALGMVQEYGFSQLPVSEDGRMVGAVEEVTIIRALHQGVSPSKAHIRDVMARPLPALEEEVLLEEAYRLLMSGYPAIVITRQDHVIGIVTRTDMMSYYEKVPRQHN